MPVLLCSDINIEGLEHLVTRYGMEVTRVADHAHIPGSFWHPPEAGLVGNVLYIRDDTPVHSALHEACHFICMDHQRREDLDTNAGGDYEEENAVCYLQVLLANELADMGTQRMFSDMDAWGYSFRLGSSHDWFEHDAEDAVEWLRRYDLIDDDHQPMFNVRRES